MHRLIKLYLEILFSKFAMVFDRFKDLSNSESRKKAIIIIFLVLVISLKLFLSEYRPDHIDPGGDSSFILDGAQNIKNGNGYVHDSIWLFDENDGVRNKDITRPGYMYPPVMPILVSIIFIFTESIFVTIMVQIFIFLLTILLYYELVSKTFNSKIAFFSSICLIANPILIYEVVAVPRNHILGLLSIVFFFFIFYKDINERYKYYLIGIVAAISYLTRDINLLLLISICIYFALNKKFIESSKILVSFMVVTFPWFYRNYKYYGTINPRATTVGYYYPPAGLPDSSTGFISASIEYGEIVSLLSTMHTLLFDFSSPEFYFILSSDR